MKIKLITKLEKTITTFVLHRINLSIKIVLVISASILIFSNCSGHSRFTRSSHVAQSKVQSKRQIRKTSHSGTKLYQKGVASYYADKFHGRQTANGEIFNMNDMTAAHKKLDFNTVVRVFNIDNGKEVTVRINDRGPFVKGRIIDLSLEAGKKLGLMKSGHANVELYIVKH